MTSAEQTASAPRGSAGRSPDELFADLVEEASNSLAARQAVEDVTLRSTFLRSSKTARKRAGLSQQQVAQLMGTTQSAVSDLESGRIEPQLETLQRYTRAIGAYLNFGFIHGEWDDASPIFTDSESDTEMGAAGEGNKSPQRDELLATHLEDPDSSIESPDHFFMELVEKAKNSSEARQSVRDADLRSKFFRSTRAVRKEKGVTQKQLAASMSTTQSAVSDLESGRVDPKLATLQRYARAVGGLFFFDLRTQRKSGDALINAGLASVLRLLLRGAEEDDRVNASNVFETSSLSPAQTARVLAHLSNIGWTETSRVGNDFLLEVKHNAAHVIGISIFNDKVVGVLIDLWGVVSAGPKVTQLVSNQPVNVVSAIVNTVQSFRDENTRILGVGVTLAGRVDSTNGDVLSAPDLNSNLANPWNVVPLERMIQDGVTKQGGKRLKVIVENDANGLAAAEYFRTRKGESVAVALITCQGVGGGYVVNGRLVNGAHNSAGEIGHLGISASTDDETCGCLASEEKHSHCLETLSVPIRVLSRLGYTTDTSSKYLESLDKAEIAASGKSGREAIYKAFYDGGRAIGTTLLTTLCLLDPHSLVICYERVLHDRASLAEAFCTGIQTPLTEAYAEGRLSFNPIDLLEWKPFDDVRMATGAGAVALWQFVNSPLRWAPEMRLDLPLGDWFSRAELNDIDGPNKLADSFCGGIDFGQFAPAHR